MDSTRPRCSQQRQTTRRRRATDQYRRKCRGLVAFEKPTLTGQPAPVNNWLTDRLYRRAVAETCRRPASYPADAMPIIPRDIFLELVARSVPMFSLTIEPSTIGSCLGCRDVREGVPNGKFTTRRIWPQWRDRKAISSLFAMRCGHNSFLVVRARERAMHPGRLDV